MLDLAISHQDELKMNFQTTWFSDKYKYWAYSSYYEEFEIAQSSMEAHQFVSLNTKGEVIGFIGYSVYRGDGSVDGLNIINFTDGNKATFGLDVATAVKDIFEKFHFRKLNFVVVIGNPVEKTYDHLIDKFNGRIVGTWKKHVKLYDGSICDVKLYEIMAEDYFKGVER